MSQVGRIEVICGPMFAGKTEELLRRVRRATVAGREVRVFGHALDTRPGASRLLSHAGLDHPAELVASAGEIEERLDGPTAMVAIDEAQFFGPALVDVAMRLAARGWIVLVAGLDVSFDGRPFEPLPSLTALAERVDKLTAICAICGEEAVFHARRPTAAGRGKARRPEDAVPEHVGGPESYEARCRRHFPSG